MALYISLGVVFLCCENKATILLLICKNFTPHNNVRNQYR